MLSEKPTFPMTSSSKSHFGVINKYYMVLSAKYGTLLSNL